MRKRRIFFLGVASWVGFAWISAAWGGSFPTRPIEIVLGFSAGSTTDLITQAVAETAKKYTGQPFIIVPKGGAGGTLAAADVVSAKPDGYKILSTTSTFFYTDLFQYQGRGWRCTYFYFELRSRLDLNLDRDLHSVE